MKTDDHFHVVFDNLQMGMLMFCTILFYVNYK